jgi:cysteine synthase A
MLRDRFYHSVIHTTFDTPLVRLNRLIPPDHATVLLKLESFNPYSSVKDRVGRAMVEAAEHSRLLHPDSPIFEATSGNTGISLAFIAAAKRYALTLVMPESMSIERRAMLRALGANVVLTPAEQGMRGAVAKAQELAAVTPHSWIPQQFENPANPGIHEATTGPEIWADSGGHVDLFVAGVGTGGTITGVTRYLRGRNPQFQALAVEPAECPVLSGGKPGAHKIQGIGAGFVPKNLDTRLLAGVETVSSEEAFAWTRRLARQEGILGGISTGANVAVAARLAARGENRGKVIVTVAASFGERYLSTSLFDFMGAQEPSRRAKPSPPLELVRS